MCEDKWSIIGFKPECPDCGSELHPNWSEQWECYHCDKTFILEMKYKFRCMEDEEDEE